MHRFWSPVIEPLLGLAGPRVLVEVGSEYGRTTRRLLEYAALHDAVVHTIDPEPRFDVDAWQAEFGDRLRLHRMASLNALEAIGPADVVLLDGDHNWYSVLCELKLLEIVARRAGRDFPLVLLHDVGWPYGRRDLYYHPDWIPDAHRQPCAPKGLRLDSPELADQGGFNSHVTHALYENSLHNGVRTAAEDFRDDAPQKLELVCIPGFHGLGILVPKTLRDRNAELAAWLERLDTTLVHGGYVEGLERSRLEAEIALQERKRRLEQLQKCHRDDTTRLAAEIEQQTSRRSALEGQLDDRRRELAQQTARADALEEQLAERTTLLRRQTARVAELERRFDDQEQIVQEQIRRLEDEARRVGALHEQLQRSQAQLRASREQAESIQSRVQQSEAARAAMEGELASCRDQLALARSELESARQECGRRQALLREHGRRIEALSRWLTSAETAVAALLGTKRWRLGDLLVRAARRVLRRPAAPPAPVTVLRDTFARFQKHRREKTDSSMPTAAPPENMEATPAKRPTSSSPTKAPDLAPDGAAAEPRVLFLLPVKGGGGGAHSVVQEASGMRRRGAHASVAIESRHRGDYERNYPELVARGELLLFFDDFDDLERHARDFDIVIGTASHSMEVVKALVDENPRLMPAYYVQDYEPWFFPESSLEWQRARESYTLVPGALLFAKTYWLCDMVRANHRVQVEKVTPSLDTAVYFCGKKPENRPLQVHIAAMIRPKTPRRAPARTLQVLKRIQREFREGVEVHVFGCTDAAIAADGLERDFPLTNHGVLVRDQVADLARQCDIFADLSDYQAFGRTALEAMACGCAVVVPREGGADEYAVDGVNARVVDTRSEDECCCALRELVMDHRLRESLVREGRKTAAEFSIDRAVESEIAVLRKHWRRRKREDEAGNGQPRAATARRRSAERKLRVAALLPTVTTNYYTGTAFIRAILPLRHPSVSGKLELKLCDVKQACDGDADVVLVQRNVLSDERAAIDLLAACRRKGKRVVYEVDDDLFAALDDRRLPAPQRQRLLAARVVAEHADLVTVSTPALAERIERLNPRTRVLPNALDEQLWFGPDPPAALTAPCDRSVRLLYMGTKTHLNDLRMIEGPLRRVLSEYGGRIEFDVIGCVPDDVRESWFRAVEIPRASREYPAFVGWLRQTACWTIGIAPLEDNGFNAMKSPLKFFDYSALGLASICSDVAPYATAVDAGTNGILAPAECESWYQALKLLIEDHEFRLKLATQAYERVRHNHVLAKAGASWLEAYTSAFTANQGPLAPAALSVSAP